MRDVTYTDGEGCRFKVRLPDEVSDEHASKGIKVGPPDLSGLGLPDPIRIRLNNQLFDRGLFSKRELRGRFQELQAALQSALTVDVQRLQTVYEVEVI